MEEYKLRIKFSRICLEAECFYDVMHDRGFLISEPSFSDADKTIRNPNGPRSPRFGSEISDNNAYAERYRCDCGRYVGAVFENEICPECNTPIQFKDTDISYTGWLNFSPYKLINPLYYTRLQSALSKKILEDIISNENIITSTGIIRKHNNDIEIKKSLLRYHNIGIYELYLHFEEIMEYFKTKRKPKAKLIDSLIKEKNMVFTSKIPVYSTNLRPQSISAESYYFSPVDRNINPLTSISINLKTARPIEVPLYLHAAQKRVNDLWDLNFSVCNTKDGIIRSQVLGGQFNYSS